MSKSPSAAKNKVRFATINVGQTGWHSIWQGVIVYENKDGTRETEIVGDKTTDVYAAVKQAREIYAERNASFAMAA